MVSGWPAYNPIDDYIEELDMFMLANFGSCNDDRKLAALRTAKRMAKLLSEHSTPAKRSLIKIYVKL